MNVTKDRSPSALEKWDRQNSFRLSCEHDRTAGLYSDACHEALSAPAEPPPGMSKRSQLVRRPWLEVDFGERAAQWVLTLVVLAAMMLVSTIHTYFNQRRPRPGNGASAPRDVEHETTSGRTRRRNEDKDDTGTVIRREISTGFVTGLSLVAPVILSYAAAVAKQEHLPNVGWKSFSVAVVLSSTLLFTAMLSCTTVTRRLEVFGAAAAYVITYRVDDPLLLDLIFVTC